MPLTADEFAREVIKAGLSTPEEMKSFWSALPSGARPKDGELLSNLLIQSGKLTTFQCSELLSGSQIPLVLGDYVLLSKIGSGGMGQVFMARHRLMDRIVAIKLLPTSLTKDEASNKRFQREVKAAARLTHPNIVHATDAGQQHGVWYLVMEYVEGVDLSSHIRKRGSISISTALEYIQQAAEGLAYAHEQGVVHRDIKPANLLLDTNGKLKILDMGLARFDVEGASPDDLTSTGVVMGTVDYMAPEQARNTKLADARADIYSLGITLHYLLTGKPAYQGDSVVEKLMAHQTHPIPSLTEACPGASIALDRLFSRMIAKQPEDRFQSMKELISQIQAYRKEVNSIATRVWTALPALDPTPEARNGALAVASPRKSQPVAIAISPSSTDESHGLTTQNTRIFVPTIKTKPAMDRLPRIAKAASSPWRQNWWKWVTVATGVFVLLLGAGIVFFLQTKDGAIRVEINDPQIEVAIKGTDIVLKQADNGKDIRVSPGSKTLVIERGNLNFESDKLVLKKGETITVDVRMVEGTVEVRQGEAVIGRGNPESVGLATKSTNATSVVTNSEIVNDAWKGWPEDAPKPAVAPFDEAQAKRHQEEWSAYLKVPVEYTNSLGMKFRIIPPGEFTMGMSAEEAAAVRKAAPRDAFVREMCESSAPEHRVRISSAFYLAVHEVTQSEYEALVGKNPAYFSSQGGGSVKVDKGRTGNNPVEQLSFSDALNCCNRLAAQNHLESTYEFVGNAYRLAKTPSYRLPTEAEWEFACRAGTVTPWSSGDDVTQLAEAIWYGANANGVTHPVGQRKANPFGLCDMHGNVWEWCFDQYDPKLYSSIVSQTAVDPIARGDGAKRILRGGDWNGSINACRSAFRNRAEGSGDRFAGFRITLSIEAVRQLSK